MLKWSDIIFAQERVGQGGVPFTIYKIRTMDPDVTHAPQPRQMHDGNDPRIIKTRRFLRTYWIDELPQVVNIARGEMTWVGLRPLRKEIFETLPPDLQKERVKYLPGMIGAVYADNIHTWDDYVAAERRYLEMRAKYDGMAGAVYFFRFLKNVFFDGLRGV